MRADGRFPLHLPRHARGATLATKCNGDIVRISLAISTKPKRRFEFTLEERITFADAENYQRQIHSRQVRRRLESGPLCHGHRDHRIIMTRAVQGHSGYVVDHASFTPELHADGPGLPELCVHGAQGPIGSRLQRGLVHGGPTHTDQVAGQDLLPDLRVGGCGPQGPEPERAPGTRSRSRSNCSACTKAQAQTTSTASFN